MLKTAIILAGGKGERLRPLTNKIPKPMVKVLGKPLVSYQVDWLKSQGITHIIFGCSYKYQVIKKYFGDGSKFGLKIDYSIEKEPLGRGGAFKQALNFVDKSEEYIVGCNGDELTKENLSVVFELHKQKKVKATILLAQLTSQFGIVDLDGDFIKGFIEKPKIPYWYSAGIYIFERSALEEFPNKGDHEDSTFPKWAKMGKLLGYKLKTFHATVNTIKEYQEAEKIVEKYF